MKINIYALPSAAFSALTVLFLLSLLAHFQINLGALSGFANGTAGYDDAVRQLDGNYVRIASLNASINAGNLSEGKAEQYLQSISNYQRNSEYLQTREIINSDTVIVIAFILTALFDAVLFYVFIDGMFRAPVLKSFGSLKGAAAYFEKNRAARVALPPFFTTFVLYLVFFAFYFGGYLFAVGEHYGTSVLWLLLGMGLFFTSHVFAMYHQLRENPVQGIHALEEEACRYRILLGVLALVGASAFVSVSQPVLGSLVAVLSLAFFYGFSAYRDVFYA